MGEQASADVEDLRAPRSALRESGGMQVYKFGGVAVGSAGAILTAVKHVQRAAPGVAAVVSAANGVTDMLLDAGQAGRDVEPGHTTGVERAHRQLGARLADRLGGDDADSLTRTDHVAGRQVPAVARPADAVASLAGER